MCVNIKEVVMRIKLGILLGIILFFTIDSIGQFKYTTSDELISFSYLKPKVEKLKKHNKINSLVLPNYNNDSLFWENNIEFLLPSYRGSGCVRKGGFVIDTTIRFFDKATCIKIKEGYLWLYKITSSTASNIGFRAKNCRLNSDEYLSIHSNLHDSIYGGYEYRLPQVLLNETPVSDDRRWTDCENGCAGNLFGNTLYIEFFSPTKRVSSPNFELFSISYGYPTEQRLSEAPVWVRKKYPDIDFDYYEKK